MKKRKRTADAVAILRKRYPLRTVDDRAEIEEIHANDEIARKIYELRRNAKLTQRQLAKLVGTTPSVISRLEDSDYTGHSLAMLRRIAAALNWKVQIRFVRAA